MSNPEFRTRTMWTQVRPVYRPSLRSSQGPALSRGQIGGGGLLVGATLFLALSGFILSEADATKLIFCGVLGLALCAWMIWDLERAGASSYCVNCMIAGSIVGNMVFMLLGATGISSGGNGAMFSLMDKPWVMLLYFNLGLLIAWLIGRLLYPVTAQPRFQSLSTQITADIGCFEALMLVGLPFIFGATLGHYVPESMRYPFDVVGAAMNMMPFFVGRFASSRRPTFWIWLAALLLNGFVVIVSGSRWAALLPISLFAVGYMFSFPKRVAWISIACASLLFVPGLWLVGVLGVIRDDLGRDPWQNVSLAHIGRMITVAEQVSNTQMVRNLVALGSNRMVPWANYAAPLLTPETIPYRGFESFPSEIRNSMSIYAFSPDALMERSALEMGTFPANSYGYMVTDETSVEWGVIADGWSRAGWWSAALFLTLVLVPVLVLEKTLVKSELFRPAVKVIFIGFLMNRSLRMAGIPMLDMLRGLATYMVAYLVVLLALNSVLNAAFPWKKRSHFHPTLLNSPSGVRR